MTKPLSAIPVHGAWEDGSSWPNAQGLLKLTEARMKNDFAQGLTLTEENILFARGHQRGRPR
jgi:hypothetical protein